MERPFRPSDAASGSASFAAASSAPSAWSRLGAVLEEVWIALFAWLPTPLGMALRLLAWRWLFASCGTVRFGTGPPAAICAWAAVCAWAAAVL